MGLQVGANLMSVSVKMCWTNFHCPGQSSTILGEWLGVKRNQTIRIIQQNFLFWPKSYPLFLFGPKFQLNNRFRHSRGRNKISNFGFRLNQNRNQKLVFGFVSGCFKSNFGCSLDGKQDQDGPHLLPDLKCKFFREKITYSDSFRVGAAIF